MEFPLSGSGRQMSVGGESSTSEAEVWSDSIVRSPGNRRSKVGREVSSEDREISRSEGMLGLTRLKCPPSQSSLPF